LGARFDLRPSNYSNRNKNFKGEQISVSQGNMRDQSVFLPLGFPTQPLQAITGFLTVNVQPLTVRKKKGYLGDLTE
jgi:hypothetical protein